MDSTEQFLSGGGEMGALIRSMDWSSTPLGPVSSWPQSLRTSVSLCLSSTFPILIAWGPETIQIYNDSYRPICGAKHPESMGQNFRICWATALPVVGDAFTRGQHGEGTYIKDQRMFLDRYGYLEEAFMTFSFAPIRDESGEVGGIFHPITESTEKMLSARRTNALRRISAAIGSAREQEEIVNGLKDLYQEYIDDCPFILLYTFAGPATLKLVCSTGLSARSDAAPAVIYTDKETPLHTEGWPFVADMHAPAVMHDIRERFADLASGSYPEPPASACIYPIRLSGRTDVFGYLVAGVSVRRAMDDEYASFFDQLSATVNTAFSSVDAFEQEARKAAELAAIDQAKTAFFNNVSHEFRTPLTLMTGPVEELMTHPALQTAAVQEPLQTVHRNALRLLRLVNNLLDFSRQEAGRVQACFQPTDLAVLTSDLAGSFRSLVEKAGLKLHVEMTGDLPDVYVDPAMWEKIVLNLLSNAFKFTLQGSITVQLLQQRDFVILQVKDTGSGIPPEHLPRMFERFHRIQGSTGRSFEGSGIGLSLVKELVQQHKGTIGVESEWEQGSCFTVRIPLGKAHLPADKIDETPGIAQHSAQSLPFLQEAAGMLHAADATPAALPAAKKGSVLITDDNADMRAYLVRLLAPHYDLQVAVNGLDALEKLSENTPDIVVSDIMMPMMDGRELLRRMRSHPMWSAIPVIFLSARAGDEAKVEGLEAGADDYLVKPFSATELLSRVRIQVNIARKRNLLENAVKQYSVDLFTANDNLGRQQEELRQFAFVSSHNLQEPLRKIRLFAGMLKSEFSNSAHGNQESFALSRITQSAEQLSELITDLLAFAQLGFDYSQKTTVDLNEVWKKVLKENSEWISTTRATVHTENLPVLHAVPDQMHLLLNNLLSNALKFHRGEPQVSIQYHIAGDDVVIVFSDRGIGFEQTQADRIFDVFQRLHKQEQYTGTGIGLSMCRKIVTAHGGTISVRSKPEAGSTFYITLPASMLMR